MSSSLTLLLLQPLQRLVHLLGHVILFPAGILHVVCRKIVVSEVVEFIDKTLKKVEEWIQNQAKYDHMVMTVRDSRLLMQNNRSQLGLASWYYTQVEFVHRSHDTTWLYLFKDDRHILNSKTIWWDDSRVIYITVKQKTVQEDPINISTCILWTGCNDNWA